jgi:RNA polymerase sigma factor (TIGR02999 family)
MSAPDGDVTRLLNLMRLGDRSAEAELFAIVYGELRRLAARVMKSERADHTLQATALVHEAYLRLVGSGTPEWQNRGHFLAVAAQAMRRVLVDHARHRGAAKRGSTPIRVPLLETLAVCDEDCAYIMALEEAMQRLERCDLRQSRVVELRYFAGMTEEEAASVLGVSSRTVKRDWNTAKAWLYSEMAKALNE